MEVLKSVVTTNSYKTGLQDLFKVLNEHHAATFTSVLFLMEIGLILPLHMNRYLFVVVNAHIIIVLL